MFNGKTKHGVDIIRTRLMPEKKILRYYFVVADKQTAHIFERIGRTKPPVIVRTLQNSLAPVDFYHRVIEELSQVAQSVQRLVLVASPQVLNALRRQLQKGRIHAQEILDFPKDLLKLQPSQISGRLQTMMES